MSAHNIVLTGAGSVFYISSTHREASASLSSALTLPTYTHPTHTFSSSPSLAVSSPLLLPPHSTPLPSDSIHLPFYTLLSQRYPPPYLHPQRQCSQLYHTSSRIPMTEYDYSPDAVERFQAKMAGVGKWASDQSYWRSGYGNPFTPDDSTARPYPPSRQESSSSRPRDRPQPSRSRTLPTNLNPAIPSGYGQTSRALAYAQAPAPRPSTASASRSHHRSGPQAPDVRNPYPYPAPPPGHQVIQGQRGSPMVYAPPGAHIVYKQYDYVPGKTTVLPPARPGEHFVVVAPPGAHVDQIRTGPHSRSSGSSKAGSPTKKSGDPFLKRILTGLRPNIDWGDRDSSRSRSSSSRRESGKRRPASR